MSAQEKVLSYLKKHGRPETINTIWTYLNLNQKGSKIQFIEVENAIKDLISQHKVEERKPTSGKGLSRFGASAL